MTYKKTEAISLIPNVPIIMFFEIPSIVKNVLFQIIKRKISAQTIGRIMLIDRFLFASILKFNECRNDFIVTILVAQC